MLSTLGTTVWFLMGNPFGIDNIYVAAVVPLIIMLIDHLVKPSKKVEA